MVQLAKAVAGEPLILFNARHREGSLRSQTCGTSSYTRCRAGRCFTMA